MITVNWEGYELRVFSTMYMDWGLEISRDGESLFYNPHCLSCESYGCDYGEDGEDEPVEWTEQDWQDRLLWEAEELVDCFVPLMNQEG
jgi:hypothetical protein